MVTPGTVSLSVGRSGSGGNRLVELSARRRTFPACTMPLEAAIDEISTGMVSPATSCIICAAERYGTSTMPRSPRLLNSRAANGAAPAVTSTA